MISGEPGLKFSVSPSGSFGYKQNKQTNKTTSAMKEISCSTRDPGVEHLEKEMTTHSSIFAWKILQTEEPGVLQSMFSQELDTT